MKFKRMGSLFLCIVMMLSLVQYSAVPVQAGSFKTGLEAPEEFGTAYTDANIIGGNLYYVEAGDTVAITACDEEITAMVIPSTINGKKVTEISDDAFWGAFSTVTIPDTVTYIGWNAFYGNNITSVIIPGSVTEIAPYAFCSCEVLTNVTIQDGTMSISDHAFLGCTALTSVTIGNGVTRIGGSAFAGCTALKSITIPSSVTVIDAHAIGYDIDPFGEEYNKITGFTIYGVAGSVAETYAKENGFAFSTDVVVTPVVTPSTGTTVAGFNDVSTVAWFADSVNWAIEQGITNGTSATTFSPDDTCTQEQIITFLYRAKGSPETSISNPYEDVKSDAYYYDAVRWSYENGLRQNESFGVSKPCSRGDVVYYLWTLAGKPMVEENTVFTDVSANNEYAQAVAWAVEDGITTGTSSTTFSPDTTCTRAQIVTFLYRAYK